MIDRLERLVGDVSALHSKLIVVVGGTGPSRSTRLAEFGRHDDAHVLNLGHELGHRLAGTFPELVEIFKKRFTDI